MLPPALKPGWFIEYAILETDLFQNMSFQYLSILDASIASQKMWENSKLNSNILIGNIISLSVCSEFRNL